MQIWLEDTGFIYQALQAAHKHSQPVIERDHAATNAFHQLKKALTRAPALSLPTQDRLFSSCRRKRD
jgi:hypothetical protein